MYRYFNYIACIDEDDLKTVEDEFPNDKFFYIGMTTIKKLMNALSYSILREHYNRLADTVFLEHAL